MQEWAQEARRLIQELPAEIQEKIQAHEAAGTTDSAEYKEAIMVFLTQARGRAHDPQPEWVKAALKRS